MNTTKYFSFLRKKRSWYQYVFFISVPFLLYLAVKDISLRDTVNALTELGFLNIVIIGLVNITIMFTMTARWWLLTAALGYKVPYIFLIGYRLAGNAVSYFTPGPQFGGEPVQVYLLHQMEKIPLEVSTASVAMDRLMELIANFTFLLIGVSCVFRLRTFNGFLKKETFLIIAILLALPIGLLWAVCTGKRPFSSLRNLIRNGWHFKTQTAVKIFHSLHSSEVQAESLCRQQPGILFQATLVSGLNWACILGEFWLMFRFLGLTLTGLQLIVIITAARFAFLMPLPAGIGALEAGQVLMMKALGLNPALGLSVCVIIRIRDLIVGSIGLGITSTLIARTNREKHKNSVI